MNPRPSFALAAPLAAALAACSPPGSTPPALPAVYVTPVVLQPAAHERRFTAVVAPRVESDLAFRTGGKVLARLVDLGQSVRAGQPLARLDGKDLRLAVDAAAEQWRAAEVDAQQAASDAARFTRLAADGSIPGADRERQQARADAAAARLAQAQRQLDLARNRDGYTTLAAPFDGVVTAVRVEPGQVVAEGQPAFAIARAQELELAVDVPEALAATLALQQASATGPAGAALPLRLRELAPSAHPATRSFRARYALAAPRPEGWRLGMTVELRLAGRAAAAVAELPAGALLKADGAPAVWLVADPARDSAGTLRAQPVEVLGQSGDRVRLRGLPDGAWVVSAGAHKLDARMRVRPVARPLDAPLPAAPAVAVARQESRP
ncbi:efflux RND transporter periplasmic adaptor subunit [Piscinibacter defluvii]|uniref:efflux RND transporter periplasmic adaptor subunit n=1 Tax=Piscinibacter defluvii TaxID=1796922 RepID=UPI0013E3A14E|nr:efflux RND transporter periplasmic adaptor subunit [Piscinibacter defluvii]